MRHEQRCYQAMKLTLLHIVSVSFLLQNLSSLKLKPHDKSNFYTVQCHSLHHLARRRKIQELNLKAKGNDSTPAPTTALQRLNTDTQGWKLLPILPLAVSMFHTYPLYVERICPKLTIQKQF